MSEYLQIISDYLSFPFVRYAFIAAILIALCAALLGVSLVLKRYSMIGDGLSHVAFGAMAVAAVFSVAPIAVVLPVTILSAILLLRVSSSKKLTGDAAIAMIATGTLAFGYLIMNLFSTSPNISGDVCSSLFGSTSILTLAQSDVWLCAVLAVIVLAVFILFYNKIFSVTFDENFAKATGIHTDAYNLIIAVITAVVIVMAMNFVGALLVSALIIFPPLSAMQVFKSFRSVMICSCITAIICAILGLFAAILFETPVGATIAAANIVAYFLFFVVGILRGKKDN